MSGGFDFGEIFFLIFNVKHIWIWVFLFLIPVFIFIFFDQIHDEASKFAHRTGVRIVVAYGGASIVQQVCGFSMHVTLALW